MGTDSRWRCQCGSCACSFQVIVATVVIGRGSRRLSTATTPIPPTVQPAAWRQRDVASHVNDRFGHFSGVFVCRVPTVMEPWSWGASRRRAVINARQRIKYRCSSGRRRRRRGEVGAPGNFLFDRAVAGAAGRRTSSRGRYIACPGAAAQRKQATHRQNYGKSINYISVRHAAERTKQAYRHLIPSFSTTFRRHRGIAHLRA